MYAHSTPIVWARCCRWPGLQCPMGPDLWKSSWHHTLTPSAPPTGSHLAPGTKASLLPLQYLNVLPAQGLWTHHPSSRKTLPLPLVLSSSSLQKGLLTPLSKRVLPSLKSTPFVPLPFFICIHSTSQVKKHLFTYCLSHSTEQKEVESMFCSLLHSQCLEMWLAYNRH